MATTSAATERTLAAFALAAALLSVLPLAAWIPAGASDGAFRWLLLGSLPCAVAGLCLGLAWRSRGPPSPERSQGRVMAKLARQVSTVGLLLSLLAWTVMIGCLVGGCV